MSYAPYPDQQIEIDKMISFVESKTSKKALFVFPTSYGKSILIANVAAAFPDKWFINIVPKKELLEQNYEKYISYGYKASICSASLGKKELGKVTFATIRTIEKFVDFYKDKEVVILCDEAHNHSLKESVLHNFFTSIKKCKLLGVTATPLLLNKGWLKMMNRTNDCFYSSIESIVQIHEVTSKNRWTPLDYKVVDTDKSMLELNTTGRDYTDKSLELYYEKNDIISKSVAAVEKLFNDGHKSCIVYFASVKEATELANRLDGFEVLHGKTNKSERTRIIRDFKKGLIKGISNVGVLIEGFDYPALSSAVMSRPTNSLIIWYQIVGRLVRKLDGKESATIIDLSGSYEKFGRVEDITFEDNPYTKGYQAWSGDKMLTGYSLKDGHQPTRSQELSRFNYIEKKKEQAKLSAQLGYVIPFGKYQGESVKEVAKKDSEYLKWTLNKSGWSFDTKNMIEYRNGVIEEIGLTNIFDMTVLILADQDFDVYGLYVNRVSHFLSNKEKTFVVLDGISRRTDDIFKTFISSNPNFLGLVEDDFKLAKVDAVIAFHNGDCARTRDRLKNLSMLVNKVKVIEY
jgi:DNA repair protein RadD